MSMRRELARKWARVNVAKAERAGVCLKDARRALRSAEHARVALVSDHEARETRLLHEEEGVSAAWLTVLGGSRARLAHELVAADARTEAASSHVHDCTEQAEEAARWQEVSARVEDRLAREAYDLLCRDEQRTHDEAATRRWQLVTHGEA